MLWGHKLAIPHIPFFCTHWKVANPLILDSIALIIGFLSIYYLGKPLYEKFRDPKKDFNLQTFEIFSFLYLFGITLSMILFQKGDLHSLNRYVFASPYFLIFLIYFYKKIQDNFKLSLKIGGFLTIFWILMGTNKYYDLTWRFFIATIFIVALLNIKNPKYGTVISIVLYLIFVIFQVYFYKLFYYTNWVA